MPMLLLVCAALAIANGLVIPTLNGLASQMIDRSWQGRALGLMQSAGSLGRLVGPLLGGWLLMFDLDRPLAYYARTPFFASAAILLVAFALALNFRNRSTDKIARRRGRGRCLVRGAHAPCVRLAADLCAIAIAPADQLASSAQSG